jgi:hypothetical protein
MTAIRIWVSAFLIDIDGLACNGLLTQLTSVREKTPNSQNRGLSEAVQLNRSHFQNNRAGPTRPQRAFLSERRRRLARKSDFLVTKQPLR